MKWSLDVNYFQFIDGAIVFYYVLTDFLASRSVHFWERGVNV